MDDPYLYPGALVLRNREAIHDAEDLATFERRMTLQRLREGIPQLDASADGFRTIHRHLFQDVYDWAGQDRTVELAKCDSRFCRPAFIAAELDKRFASIQAEHALKGLTFDQFASRAAEHVSEVNAIHPFREGNGRALRALLEVLAGRAGHRLDITRITPGAWHEASVVGFMRGDYQPMRRVIAGAISRRATAT